MTTRLSNEHFTNVLGVLVGLTLITTFFFWPTYISPFESGKTIFFFLFIELALPVYTLLLFRTLRPAKLLRNPILVFFFLLLIITALSAALGVDPFNSFLGSAGRSVGVIVFTHGFLFILYLTYLFSTDEHWKRRLTDVLIIVASIVAVYSLLEYKVLPAFVAFENRSAGFLGNPIFLGAYLIIPLFIAMSRAVSKSQTCALYLAAGALMTAAIFASGTRGALAGLLAGVMFWIVVYAIRNQQKRRRTLMTVIAASLGIVIFLIAFRAITPNFTALTRLSNFSDTNIQTRLAYWDMSLRSWTDAPLLGVGLGNFYRVADQSFTAPLYELTDAWPDKPHNAFIEWLVTTGVLGLSVFLILMWLLFAEGLRRRTHEDLLLTAGLAGYLAQSAFAFYTIGDLLPFLFLIALLAPKLPTTTSMQSCRIMSRTITTISVAISLAGLFLLTIPYHRLALAVGQGNKLLETDPLGAAEQYDKAASHMIVLDDTLISKKYLDAVHSWVTQQEAPLPETLYDGALASARLTVARHPRRATFWNNLSRLMFFFASDHSQKVAQEGIDAALRAIELAPERIEARRTLGYIWAQNDELDQAREMANSVLQRKPDQPNALWLIAQIDFMNGNETEAAGRGYEVFFAHPEAFEQSQLIWIVQLLAQQEAYQRVVDLYVAWVHEHPDDLTFLPNLAATYAAIGDNENAKRTANLLKQKDPTSAGVVDAFLEGLD